VEFTGFPVAALDFYDDLEVDNTKSFWEAHKQVYADAVKAPMTALCAALAPEFGEAKIFRPYRDVRFAKDKTPYKTSQGAHVATGSSTGWYVQVSAQGVMTGAGFYDADTTQLAAFREAIDEDKPGRALARLVTKLTGAGWEVGGDRLKTAPRGYSTDHPRIELLRHRSLTVSRQLGFAPVIHQPELLDVVGEDWRNLRPFVSWIGTHVHG
jgi:uncharacterized protein (TIGR02453 family)